MANTLTIILALALIVCPVIIPVYESAGFDTVEIMQTTQDITRIDYTTYASQPKDTPGTPPCLQTRSGTDFRRLAWDEPPLSQNKKRN